ncbi:MAG: flagellar motor protein MotB, partial [Longimicrobiales bacterium]
MSGGTKDKVVIVVRKRKKGGDGHHGGSWKVAYADFVTAMMAFFLVMWIVGMDSEAKDLVQGYFNNPVGFRRAFGAGADPTSQGSTPVPSDLQRIPLFIREMEERRFSAVRDEILRELEALEGAEGLESRIEVVVTPEGLRIELREGEGAETFFTIGSDELKPAAREALVVIARNLEAIPNHMVIEGHTDSAPFPSATYTNWELSVDRANAARRTLVESGFEPSKVQEVR